MKSLFLSVSGLCTVTLTALLFVSLPPVGVTAQAPVVSHGGPLLNFDFNSTQGLWPADTAPLKPLGTVDTAGSVTRTGAVESVSGTIVSGLLPVRNTETNLAKLTLSFDHSASAVQPVTVRVESFDAAKKRTGGREAIVYPAAPDFYIRSALELSTMKPFGGGSFKPTDPFVQITFTIAGSGTVITVDNVEYATPAYYVSPKGRDTNDGRTEKTAFATPQKAVDTAGPGDIVVLMEGKYNGGSGNVISFRRAGTAAAWITVKNYPGQKPTLTCNGWNTVSIAAGSKQNPDTETNLAYLEIRGLHVRGDGDTVRKRFPEAIGKPDPRTNTNGIAIDGRYMKNIPHHIRIADCLVEYCPAGGMGPGEADWVTMENNISRFNCWTTIYGASGMGTLGASNFDGLDNVYKMLIRNNIVYRNQTYENWEKIKKPSDGNGIIIDVNQRTDSKPNGSYLGRTLVQGNLSFDNGGSGIHTVRANRVDIINNTAYLNSANKFLEYSQIFTYGSEDVHIMNNILVAPAADIAAGEKPEPVNRISGPNKNVAFSHNVYFGGNIAPSLGEGDVIADPGFVRPTRDGRIADFHLKPGSPALGKGITAAFLPYLDLDGKRRKSPPTIGAYEK